MVNARGFCIGDLSMFIWLENGLRRESVKSEVVVIGESDQKKNQIRSKMCTLRESKC